MVLRTIMITILTVIQPLRAAPERDATPRFDAIAFNDLTVEERADALLAALRWRESQLDGFSYALTETVAEIKRNAGLQEPFERIEVELDRLGFKSLLHARRVLNGKEWLEVWTSWDGTVSRSRYRRPERNFLTGRIADAEEPTVRETYFNDLLGYRISSSVAAPITRAEWLAEQMKMPERVSEISAVTDAGETLVRLTITLWKKEDAERRQQLWFDPARDFMLVKEEYNSRSKTDFGFRRSNVTGAQEADGLWVPAQATQVRSASNQDDVDTRHDWEVLRFTRGTVAENNLKVEFPPGTKVVDSIEKKAFKIREDGSQELIPLYDRATGISTIGPHTADDVFKDATPPFAASYSWTTKLTTILAVLGLLGCALLFLIRSRRGGPSVPRVQ